MTTQPLATIIVTPRERYSVAPRTLAAIAANTPEDHRLVYVAGGAPPPLQEHFATACSSLGYNLILHPDFLPPNAARNLGLIRATTKYVVFIENDVLVEPGWLGSLIRCAEEEDADLVGPLCLMGEPSECYLHSMGGLLAIENRNGQKLLRERPHFRQGSLRTNPKPLTRLAADYSEFHCALIRRSVFEQIGPLDEQITGAAEHIDLALHLGEHGLRGFCEPAAVVSYLPVSYSLCDLETYAPRWSEEWHTATMTHLVRKWALSPESELLRDYRSSLMELRERCLLRTILPEAPSQSGSKGLGVAQTIVQLLNQMEALGYPLAALEKIHDAYLVVSELFAASFRASGRTLLAHSVGVGSIMAAFGANPTVIAAGTLHAGYAHGHFPTGFGDTTAGMRRWLRRRVGDAVEALVYEYSRLRLEDVESYLPLDLDRMPVELANVVMIRVANGIEDRSEGDHRYFDSSTWLRESNANIERWMPAFRAIAERLGMAGLTSRLEEAVAKTRSDGGRQILRITRPLNYAIQSDSRNRVMQPLAGRNLFEADESTSSPATITPIPLDSIISTNGGLVARETDGLMIVSDPRPWAYSACSGLEGLVKEKGPAILEMCLRVERGTLGILVLEQGSSTVHAVPEQSLNAGAEPVILNFEIAAIEEAGNIIFRGWPTEEGCQTQARMFAMSVRT